MQQTVRVPQREEDGKIHISLEDMDGDRQDKDIAFQGSIVGDFEFHLKRHHEGSPRMTADILMIYRGQKYVGPDESITIIVRGRKEAEKRPGEAVGLVFYPSPDGKVIAVFRKIYRGMNVAYGYRAASGKLIPIRFGQKRLDEYILDRFLSARSIPARVESFDTRVFHFERWQASHLLRTNFSLGVESDDAKRRAGFAVVDMLNGKVVQMEEVTGKPYNFSPNERA